MKKFLLLFAILLFSSSAYSLEVKSELYNPPLPYQGNTEWGNDLLVSSTEPFGKVSGAYRLSNTTIYTAVPDTSILPGKCIVILASSNNGANWSIAGSVSPSAMISKSKMVSKSGGDSIYCFFQLGSTVYTWNVITNNLTTFTTYTNVNNFDAAISSTNSLYLIIDLNTNNDVRIFGSANGGGAWGGAVFLSSTGANPNIYMSGTGDTVLISYNGVAILSDTNTSAIRTVRYRESAPGTLVIVGTFLTPITAGTAKPQFKAVMSGGKAWLFYSSGTPGSIDMNCMQSNDNGATFGTSFTINSMPGRDEFWFDAAYSPGGVDLVYVSDSTGGPINNTSRKLYYSSASSINPSSFAAPVQISQRPPLTSSRGYTPSIIEYYNGAGDLGVVWVGLNGSNASVYYDRYNAVTSITHNGNVIADKFVLEQNYPNPFNPSTVIGYQLPVAGFVSLKIFDASGREVACVIDNEFKQANSYSVSFNAGSLSTGVYFYSLETEGFKETKKMILVK
ncbi:MAG: T9SS type A sorting domain-containing protein [Ignavibacteria bacterium]|nr:T9SS type A sorting domain-containing protein [Ignavibacteria bacterium]